MGLPFTKTVTLVWDGVDWRDKETGVLVTGVQRLYEPEQVRLHNGAVVAESAHPFDKSFAVTYEQVQQMIDQALSTRRENSHVFRARARSNRDRRVSARVHQAALASEINKLSGGLPI